MCKRLQKRLWRLFSLCTSSHPHIITSSHIHIFTSSHPHIFECSHLHLITSSHLQLLTSSSLHILTSSSLHILTSSHLHNLISFICTLYIHIFFLWDIFIYFLSMFHAIRSSQLHILLYFSSLWGHPSHPSSRYRWYKPFPVMGGLWHCFNHITTTVEVNLLGMVVIDEQLGFVWWGISISKKILMILLFRFNLRLGNFNFLGSFGPQEPYRAHWYSTSFSVNMDQNSTCSDTWRSRGFWGGRHVVFWDVMGCGRSWGNQTHNWCSKHGDLKAAPR